VVEKGAEPQVSPGRRRLLKAARALTTPLLPDDYIALMNPLWSTRELTGTIERIEPETTDASTIVIRPSFPWPPHEAGQYLRIGVEINGIRHWRAYSLTSDPEHPDGLVSITVKHVPTGKMSPYFTRQAEPGSIVFLGEVEGTFCLPDPLPAKSLFVSAGSGITPIMSMLRSLDRQGALNDVIHLHSDRSDDWVIFGDYLCDLDRRSPGYDLHLQMTGEKGRIGPKDLDDLCADWRQRETFLSGPGAMLDAMSDHWENAGPEVFERLHMERFQPKLGLGEEGEGGKINFVSSELEVECQGGTPILVAGEEAGLDLPFGCREGICHTCISKLCSGRVRDMRNGEIYGAEGEMIRTCISAPEGPIEIDR
jgi:stearoyl-CoA 9-desaturase NADPH oxidoreductase